LQPRDDVAALTAAGIIIIAQDQAPSFEQPCVCYENKRCTIYAKRPKGCADFRCRVLVRLEKRELSATAAMAIVEDTVRERDRVRDELRSLTGATRASLVQLCREWQEFIGGSNPVTWAPQHQQTLIRYGALLRRFKRDFGMMSAAASKDR
jgi:hypothetical protein